MLARRIIYSFLFFCLLAGANLNLSASEAHLLDFKVGKYTVDSTYKYNARAIARVREAFASESICSVTVTAYSSPDGKYSRNRQLSSLRAASVNDFISSFVPSGVAVNTVLVAEDWDGVLRYFKRSSLEWKDEAIAILSSKEGDKKALLQDLWVGEAWDDLLKNCFPALRRVVVSIEKTAPAGAQEAGFDVASIVFNSGSSALTPSIADNSTGFSILRQLASGDSPTLYIYIKASPEGEEAANQALSIKRADRIKTRLISLGYTGEVITVYQGEDWEGLADMVRESSDMPDKDAVLDILADKSLDRAARKQALQKLSYGRTWLRLMNEEMTGLRKAVISPVKE